MQKHRIPAITCVGGTLKPIGLRPAGCSPDTEIYKESPIRDMSIPIYYVQRTLVPIAAGGRLGWPDWKTAERIDFIKIRHEPEDDRSLHEHTQVASLWDDGYLYLAFSISDHEVWATITKHDERLFVEECVEFFMDPDGDGRRYIEAQINSLGTIRDLLVDTAVSSPTAAEYDAMAAWHFQNIRLQVSKCGGTEGEITGWTLQIAIPWAELDFSQRIWPPRPGDVLRINFYRYERPRFGTGPLELSGWSRVEGSFHQPNRFGFFIFRSSAADH